MKRDEKTRIQTDVRFGEDVVSLDLEVPARTVPTDAVLPVILEVTNAVVGAGVDALGRRGGEVSCRAGCGQCCRQFICVSSVELRSLRRVVAGLPPERRRRVEARFAAAEARLREVGLYEALMELGEEGYQTAIDYFRLGIDCPFLEDESCSIYPMRPSSCREYLVTSPPEDCATLDPESPPVGVPLAAKPSRALRHLDDGARPDPGMESQIPMILTLSWPEARLKPALRRTGPAHLRAFFALLTGKSPAKGKKKRKKRR